MKIIIHCGSGGPGYPWGPRSIDEGIGGSEEAVIYLSRELAAMGHEVSVYNRHTPVRELLTSGLWLDVKKHEPRVATPDVDIFIAWRDWHLFAHAPEGAKKYLWCHDIPVEPHFSGEAMLHFDKAIVLNEYHRTRYGLPPEKAFVCSNGIDVSQFEVTTSREDSSGETSSGETRTLSGGTLLPMREIPLPMRERGKCIYFSHPHRGLERLREYWPEIKRKAPHATLHSFWWQPKFFLPPNETLGIMPMRSLGHQELAREILSADLFTYPSQFDPEINPITCLKAQAGGAWPVTVNCGGMAETLEYGTVTTHDNFVNNVVRLLQNPIAAIDRRTMMADIQSKYSWATVAKRWEAEFEKELAE